ncbi:MAG TPA: class I SAM-dependent methyltransferase, partial [Acidimicrobiales bacterium]|nr:class I SAM-dependent methyltransferase [Acidimicrobiales bacterium]
MAAGDGRDAAPGEDELRLFAFKVWSYKQGEVVSLMIHLGDRLGLYRAMAGAGPLTTSDLAAATGLHERWLLEWLRSQAAAGLIDSEDGSTFELGPAAEAVLADEGDSLWFAAGAFHGGVAPPDVVDKLADAFRTGQGLTYDDQGPSAAHRVERTLGPWSRLALVPRILPALEGVVERLERGARVVDVGCGAGVALLAMAEAFPGSRFDGYDPSQHAIQRARAKLAESGLQNVTFHLAEAAELPEDGSYDFILTLDCLHDMARPEVAVAAIRRAIADDGTWLIKDIRSSATWAENRRNPMLAMMYGTSVASCMSSALSEPGGAGLGTMGLPEPLARQMTAAAGFTRFATHDFDDPANLYYEVR